MKKKWILAVLLSSTITFSGMPGSVFAAEEVVQEESTASQADFLNDLKAGLEARWKIDDESGDPASMSSDEAAGFYINLATAEYDALEKYKDKSFDNKKFSIMAAAYIDAIETQKKAAVYYKDSNAIYDQLWSAGYNVRSLLLPDFVDYYGLDFEDDTVLQEFRNNKALLEDGNVTYTISTDTVDSTTSDIVDTDGVNMGEEQQPIEIYNNDGIKITITKYQRMQDNSARLTMSVVNLYHKDLFVSSSNTNIIVNGTSVNCMPYGDIQSGKIGEATLDIYQNQLNGISIDDVTSIDFKLSLYVDDTFEFKGETDVYLSVNNGVVTQRVVYTDKDNIKKVQQLLTQLGYNSGSTDGIPGKLTNSAILQFEKDHGLVENTDITPELISVLEKAAQ